MMSNKSDNCKNQNRMFVYQMPYAARKGLCRILDSSDQWEELGCRHMHFDHTQVQCLRRKDSPTDALLTDWGNQNHTVDELFVLLSRMQNYRAMSVLKECVQEKYHFLLHEGEEFMLNSSDRTNMTLPQHGYTPTAPPFKNRSKQYCGDEVETNFNHLPDKRDMRNKGIFNDKKIQNVSTGEINDNGNQKSSSKEKHSSLNVEGSIPEIPFEELETATNMWDVNCILGKGGFGTVYKGFWKQTHVAVKKLQPQDSVNSTSEIRSNTVAQSVNELRALNNHRHDNILSIYGYSMRRNVCCLVYQFMANGSLDDRLHRKNNTPPLDWWQRLNIMTGTARAIQFIHSLSKNQNAPLVHGDIKCANILLDHNFEPRLGDFGLAREGPHQMMTHIKVSKVHGTRPYLPDEFLKSRKFSVKVDTYSFGVVLFEVATGLRAHDKNRKKVFLKDYVVTYPTERLSDLIDVHAGIDICSSGNGLISVGCRCVADLPRERPNMVDVLQEVENLFKTYQSIVRSRTPSLGGSYSSLYPTPSRQPTCDVCNKGFPGPFQSPDLVPNAASRIPACPDLSHLHKVLSGMTIQQPINQGQFRGAALFPQPATPVFQPTISPTNMGPPVYPPPQLCISPPSHQSPVSSQHECQDQPAVEDTSNIPDLTRLLQNSDTDVNGSTLPTGSSAQPSKFEVKDHIPDTRSTTCLPEISIAKVTKSDSFKISLPSEDSAAISPMEAIVASSHLTTQTRSETSKSVTNTSNTEHANDKDQLSESKSSSYDSNSSNLPHFSTLLSGKN